MDRMLNMIVRMVMRKLLSRGIDAGINRAMGPKSANRQGDEMDAKGRETAKRACQAAKVTRRMTKF